MAYERNPFELFLSMSNFNASSAGSEARQMKTVWWILCLATVCLIFDGYDLVVYGAVVSTFLRDA